MIRVSKIVIFAAVATAAWLPGMASAQTDHDHLTTTDHAAVVSTARFSGVIDADDFNLDGKSDLIWRNETSSAHYIWLLNGTTVLDSRELTVGSGDEFWKIQATGDF